MTDEAAVVCVATAVVAGNLLAPILAALITAGYQALAAVASWIVSWVVVTKRLGDSLGVEAVMAHLAGRGFNAGVESYVFHEHYVKSLRERRHVFGRLASVAWRICLYKGAPILYVPPENRPDGNPRLMYLRGTVDFDAMLAHVEQRHAEHRKGQAVRRFCVIRHGSHGLPAYDNRIRSVDNSRNEPPPAPGEAKSTSVYDGFTPVGWERSDLGLDTEGAQIEELSLAPELLDVVRDIRFWHAHRDWYQERGVPWRRGYLLHGKPGTGKTSFVRAIAEHLDLPVHVFDLVGLSNGEFVRAWAETKPWAPRIVLIEDIDAVFNGRERVHEGVSLSFDTVLNVLDGVEREDGLLLFVTTNFVDRLDDALGVPDASGRSTRPGRIDRAIEFVGLDAAGRLKLARRILKDEREAERVAAAGDGDTAAQFQERAMREALRMLWGEAGNGNDQRENA